MLVVNTHRHLCSIIGLGPAKQAVEEIKGQPEKFAILWKRWTAERVERSENTGSWIGAVGTRKLDVMNLHELRLSRQSHTERQNQTNNPFFFDVLAPAAPSAFVAVLHPRYFQHRLVRPDETRKAERACVNTTSDQHCWT